MKEIVEKLKEIEYRTSRERGDYNLFALFLREDSNKWDILVSSSWLSNDKEEGLNYLAKNIQQELTNNQFLLISRIVVVEDSDLTISAIQETFNFEHNSLEVKDFSFFGILIKHAYIITSRKKRA